MCATVYCIIRVSSRNFRKLTDGHGEGRVDFTIIKSWGGGGELGQFGGKVELFGGNSCTNFSYKLHVHATGSPSWHYHSCVGRCPKIVMREFAHNMCPLLVGILHAQILVMI